MRIDIRSDDDHLTFYFPNFLLMGRLGSFVLEKAVMKSINRRKADDEKKALVDSTKTSLEGAEEENSKEQSSAAGAIQKKDSSQMAMAQSLQILFPAFRKAGKIMRKKYPGMPLVEVLSSDGDEIRIQL